MIRSFAANSSREPVFKKRACFGAFHAASDGVHHAAANRPRPLMEAKPVREMQLARQRCDFKTRGAKLEKPLLEHDAQHLVAQEFSGALRRQSCLQPVAVFQSQQLTLDRDSWEFEQVEGAIHGVYGEKPCWCAGVLHAVQKKRHVSIGDPAQRAAAHSPIERGYACSGKCAYCRFLSYVGLQCVDGACAHRIDCRPAAIESKSTAPLQWPAATG